MEEKSISAAFVAFSYPDYPSEIVDHLIKRSQEAAEAAGVTLACREKVIVYEDAKNAVASLKKSDWDFIIAVIVSWIEAPNAIAVLREFFDKPILLWGHTMFKEKDELLTMTPLPGAAVVKETLEEMGAKFKFIWGMPDDEEVKREIESFARAAHCVSRLATSKVGLLGYASMGMYTGTFDHVKLRAKIGPEIDHLGQYVLIKKMDEIKDEEAKSLAKDLKAQWEISERVSDKDIENAAKMYLALKSLARDFGWDALVVKCQYELSRYYKMVPCVPLSILADELPCSCEGDVPLIITQLIMHYISGKTTSYGDVHDIKGKAVLLGACGFAPLSLLYGKPHIERHTALYEGLLTTSPYKLGKVTLARLASDKDGYKMHIAVGTVELPEKFHEVGCPPYPAMKVILDGDARHFGQNLMSQHYAIVYGDISKELLEVCKLLNIRPVVS